MEADIIVFNNDSGGKMDSFSHVTLSDEKIPVLHTGGEKLVTVICAPDKGRYKDADVSSFQAFARDAAAEFRFDSPSSPTMSGSCVLGDSCSVMMSRVLSEVRLNSVSCDLTGSDAEGETITDVKAYLINVSALCRMLGESPYLTSELINHAEVRQDDLNSLNEGLVLCREMDDLATGTQYNPGIGFHCYPNQNPEDTQLCPFTRLVIEGRIRGNIYYWPVNIGRDAGGDGIARGRVYDLDVHISRPGSTDPDIPASEAAVTVKCNSNIWNEKDEQYEIF